jgi:mRNA interferase MazF
MKLDAGDLVLVPFPFTDLSSAKARPALVLSAAAYNEASRDVILCGVTSNLANAAHSVLVEPGDMASGKLLAPSRIKVDKVVTLQQSLLRKRLGSVEPAILAAVLREFRALFP